MILKQYEISKIKTNLFPIILFYGQNNGAKEEEILNFTRSNKDVKHSTYEEKQILDNYETFYNDIASESLFGDKKIFIIKRATDKLVKILEDILEKKFSNFLLILDSTILDKKSKLRNLFEKDKRLICIPFYSDNVTQLTKLTNDFFKKINFPISQSNINLIVSKSNGDRGILKNELTKVEMFIQKDKQLNTSNLLKLINIAENLSISDLVDQCLARNDNKIMNILNENNFSSEDCIIIVRTFLNKSKKILKLTNEYEKNKNLDLTISSAKPPIFWKDKEITKQQISKWKTENIKNLIYKLNEIEFLIKKNYQNSVNLTTNFILEQCSSKINNLS